VTGDDRQAHLWFEIAAVGRGKLAGVVTEEEWLTRSAALFARLLRLEPS
jgi:hypothetical protein